jgi:hypothetical protein
MNRAFKISVARLAALAALATFALAGCGGGAGTEKSPVTTGPSVGPSYTGPAPANADIQAFRVNFWENVRGGNRCGSCHTAGGQAPQFARSDDVNAAYQQASLVVNRSDPSQSIIVQKVGGGHNCWLADAGSCASIVTRWITDWVGASATGGRQIQLTAPTPRDPGQSKRFPASPPSEFSGLYDLLDQYCSNCHQSDSVTKQSPYFAAGGRPNETGGPSANSYLEAYNAAIPKINLDRPADSRFVIRLGRESHNCWSDCAQNAATIQAAIQQMADAIPAAHIDPSLVVSKALTLFDGTVASGGNRYENNLIALYEFKTMQGSTAFDTSGVDPAADLDIIGKPATDFDWVGGWGLIFKTPLSMAKAATTTSRKFHQFITATGEYSIEAWVVPGNVTQEDARIVSYSGSKTTRNFTVGQTLYNYDFFNRSSTTGLNGTPQLSTDDDDERLQAALQHVVVTFDPVNGRRIYVNGEFTGDLDPAGGGTLGDWDNSFAFVLGNEVSGDRPWSGVVRLVAIHSRALTLQQIQQNFQAGVGQKFFLLFGIEHIVNVPRSYVLFEVSQYDSTGYLFTNPKFISLDANAKPGSIALKGMRIGLNGAEPPVGQAYRLLDTTIADASYSAATGQTLSTIGTIIGVEKGPTTDEFFLCFDQLGSHSNVCSQYATGVPKIPADLPKPSDIGVRTFDEINATMAAVTGVSPNAAKVKATYTTVRQSLPATSDIQAFLSSHQTSIAQLGVQYCAALIDDASARAAYFPGFNFGSTLTAPDRDLLINPLISKVVGNASSQPHGTAIRTRLDKLIDDLCTNSGGCSGSRTADVAKAVCGSVVGNAAMLIK